MPSIFRLLATLALAVALPAGAGAQTPLAADTRTAAAHPLPSLREALAAAWALSPAARSADSRRAEVLAREHAASSWINGSPSALLAQRSDRLSNNGGFREYEAELELPIWSPGGRSAAQRELAAQRLAFEPQQHAAQLRLAADVREAAAGLALARSESEQATRKHKEAQTLAQDVERRVKAGDSARVDALQAQSQVAQAASAEALASMALLRRQHQWQVLTGLAAAPSLGESPPDLAATLAPAHPAHPALQAAAARVQAAQAALERSETDRRDPMAIGVGVTRERASFGATGETSLRLALKIPLGTDARNAPRIAAARAELDAAQAERDAIERQLQGDLASARAELESARRMQAAMAERARLASEVQALVAKAYRLGESDLPTRLRADSEKFEADLSLARAHAGLQRAISQLNQSLGLLP